MMPSVKGVLTFNAPRATETLPPFPERAIFLLSGNLGLARGGHEDNLEHPCPAFEKHGEGGDDGNSGYTNINSKDSDRG